MKTLCTTSLLLTLAIAGCTSAGDPLTEPPPRHDRTAAGDWVSIQRGRYLTRIADCQSCHTAENSAPFAGGRAVPTPFGVIYSTNITPDPTTGIGHYTNQDFYHAMHYGMNRLGEHLYPAFPYPWYTKLSRPDVLSIKAYLDTVKPVLHENKPTELPWPMSMRWVMSVWNGMYFDKGAFRSDPHQSAQWNRGAYLVQAVGHCGACHTPKNFAGAPQTDDALRGGMAEHVFAPSLGPNPRSGIGAWSEEDIVEYLHTGTNAKSSAAGPMADVVEHSTQYLHQSDLRAIAVYLKHQPGEDETQDSEDDDVVKVDDNTMARGHAVYVDNCTACHMSGGTGMGKVFPPLKDSSAIQAAKPQTLIEIVLMGGRKPATASRPTALAMPAYRTKLDDSQVADVLTYVRNAWGNHASVVSTDQVASMRQTLGTSKQKQ